MSSTHNVRNPRVRNLSLTTPSRGYSASVGAGRAYGTGMKVSR